MKYLPFDKEIALEHPERVVRRDGVRVKVVQKRVKEYTSYPLEVYFINGDKEHYTNKGTFYGEGYGDHPQDLFLLPEIKQENMNYKDFDLQKALEKPERVVFRNGEKAYWHYFEEVNKLVVTNDKGTFVFITETKGNHTKGESPYDLMLLPEKKRIWINIYIRCTTGDIWTTPHNSLSYAEKASKELSPGFTFLKTIEEEVGI